jgi:hypothetical protein
VDGVTQRKVCQRISVPLRTCIATMASPPTCTCARATSLRQQLLSENPLHTHSSLGNNQLNGTIPSSLSSLTELQSLCVLSLDAFVSSDSFHLRTHSSLYGNQLTGSIPSSLSSLTGLSYLCVPRLDASVSSDSSPLHTQLPLQQSTQRKHSVQPDQLDGAAVAVRTYLH